MLDHNPRHGVRPEHPERPERLRAALAGVQPLIQRGAAVMHTPSPATAEQLTRVHTHAHVDRLLALHGKSQQLDPDTSVTPGSVHAARLAAGAALQAATHVMKHEGERAWALTRPPGHHATRSTSMGFCLLSNLAIAVRQAQHLGAQRVLIVDFDVHAGNGTMDCLHDDPNVLIFDLHQSHHYPYTGEQDDVGLGAAYGKRLNLPVPSGRGGEVHREAFERWLLPIARSFAPDLVVVAAGFDAHRSDPLGGLNLHEQDFAFMVRRLCQLADATARGRLLLTLEGGYDLDAIASSVRACAEVLAAADPAQTVEIPRHGSGHGPDSGPDTVSSQGDASADGPSEGRLSKDVSVAALSRVAPSSLIDDVLEVARSCGWRDVLQQQS